MSKDSKTRDMYARCRFDIESLENGLSNEIILEAMVDLSNDIFTLENVFSYKLGRIDSDGTKISKFTADKELGNTDLLDEVLASGNYIEFYSHRVMDDGTIDYGRDIYLPYKVLDHPCYKPSVIDFETYDKEIYIEYVFGTENHTRYMYVNVSKLSDVDNIDKAIDALRDLECEDIKGIVYHPYDSNSFEEEYYEIEFFDAAGIGKMLTFDYFDDFIETLKSVRFVRIE